MAVRSSLAGMEVPIIGSDSIKWFNVSVPSTSPPSTDSFAPPTVENHLAATLEILLPISSALISLNGEAAMVKIRILTASVCNLGVDLQHFIHH
ncbi:hypothetical protein L1987_54767 [Smallanthus sonchifolius]|uniref:Uncharacterized protein n=2 Tax=Smallanthus sonchifolius TaxID=185202 RepID=A0ACB9E7I4_9ASTR|nr:hypothetical protein L1987_54765 [Smallanthus sonchifolius]KAI3754975.1 hypothetical protein L1987_54767 [Smallanthus sonchifolius]